MPESILQRIPQQKGVNLTNDWSWTSFFEVMILSDPTVWSEISQQFNTKQTESKKQNGFSRLTFH